MKVNRAVNIDIDIKSPLWGDEMTEAAKNYIHNIFCHAAFSPYQDYNNIEISILLVDDDEMATINDEWRGKNTPTNVLSFPMMEMEQDLMPDKCQPLLLGDIILSFQTIEKEAQGRNIPFNHHLAHLLAHGLLHLIGHDHIEDGEAKEMENIESDILKNLGISDPYALTI